MTNARPPDLPCAPEPPAATVRFEALPENDEPAKCEAPLVMSQAVLFEAVPDTHCDACGKPLPEGEGDEGYGFCGSGVYLSVRGGDVRLEGAPLCPACASAIGITAHARWEIEEEEG